MSRIAPWITAASGLCLLAACGGDRGDQGLGPTCRSELAAATAELDRAEARGLSGGVTWSKAASLLAAAKVQEQFEEYQNCTLKARQARRYLAEL